MPRVRDVTLDGLTMKISPLTYDEVEEYIKSGKAMLAKDPKPTDEEWAMRSLNSVCIALNKASGNGNTWDPKKLTGEVDMVMINKLYAEFMEMSGLTTAVRSPGTTGEVPATSTLR